MRFIYIFMLVLPMTIFSADVKAGELSEDNSKKMFTELVHSFYESDADTFWQISSKFNKRLFENQENIQSWMEERTAPQETYLKVKGILVSGTARITSEKINKIEFRFDGAENSPTRVIVVTAWVDRVIEFDESVRPEQRVVNQVAILKIYVMVADEKLDNFKSDEINFGYTFAADQVKKPVFVAE